MMMPRISLAILCTVIFATTAVSGDDCRFPAHWHGMWKVRGYRTMKLFEVTSDKITGTGKCVRWNGDNKYLLVQTRNNSDGRPETCYTCMVFTVRHVNAIQYKKGSACNLEDSDDLMDRVCAHQGLSPSGNLETMVRVDAVPIACPEQFQHSRTFAYSIDQGNCPEEATKDSQLHQCASDSRVRMVFEPCPTYSYSHEDYEFECLASWEDGGDWLFVRSGRSDYRCMYRDPTSTGLAMSADSSCVGLSLLASAPIYVNWLEAVNAANRLISRCSYPSWFGETEWVDLQAKYIYRFDQSTQQLVVDEQTTSEPIQRHTCHQKDKRNKYITEVINGCNRGYQCVIVRKITPTVAEITIGEMTEYPATACSWSKTSSAEAQIKLLQDINADPSDCPIKGGYSLQTSVDGCAPTVDVSCTSSSSITIRQCNGNMKHELSCSSGWIDEGVSRVILSNSAPPYNGNCYKYELIGDETIFTIDENCNHEAPLIFNTVQLQPPFKLYNHSKDCVEKISDGAHNQSGGNLAMHSASNALCASHGLLIITSLIAVLKNTIVISIWSLHKKMLYNL